MHEDGDSRGWLVVVDVGESWGCGCFGGSVVAACGVLFVLNGTATYEIYFLCLHDDLRIYLSSSDLVGVPGATPRWWDQVRVRGESAR